MDQMRFQRGLILFLISWVYLPVLVVNAQFSGVRQQTEDMLLLAPRSLTRLLREGEVAIAEGRFADGVSALGAVLLDDSGDLPEDLRGQDFFVEVGTRGLFQKSAKGEAIRLLSALPPEGRQTLQIQYGVTARNELDKAIAAGDFDSISEVARKYVHTEAGYDAQVLIAQHKLASGYPLAAASILQNLLDFPAARSRFGVQLVHATAMAMLQADQPQLAAATLKMAARDFPNSSLNVGGQQIELRADTDWMPVLDAELAKSKSATSNSSVDAWLTTGGSPQRNAIASAGLPISSARWVKEIHSSVPEGDALLEVEEIARKTGNVILPKFELRMVDGTIITKTTDARVIGIDFETGNVSWEHYFGSSAAPLRNFTSGRNYVGDELISHELQKRVWGSTAFGRIGCDQNNFYYISSEGEQPIDPNRLFGPASTGRDSNYLEGVSIAAQGAILWRVGGTTGQDEPRLANAYFLGPPLSYEGQLYCLVEINGETKLVVLDPKSGKLLWKQQLAHASTLPIQYDEQRQSQALSPTIADGIVVCPTGFGALVAVDLLSRSLRWGATYRANTSNPNAFRAGAFGMSPNEFSPLSRRWEDAAMIADAGRIVVSPPDSEFVFCRDSLTGGPIVASHPRRNARYVAGLYDDTIILVAETGASAVSLRDKRLSWDMQFPNGATLAGKGLWQGDKIMLPLSNQQVIRVSLNDGAIIDFAEVDQPLGNLFAYRNQILSVTSTAIAAYYTRESLSQEIEKRIAAAPNDPWVLNRQSQLLHADGKLDDAIEVLQRSLKLEANNADTRFLLIEFLLEGLEKDFDKYVVTANEIGSVVEYGPQRSKYLQQLAIGNIRAGQQLDAFEHLIELMNDRTELSLSGSHSGSTQIRLSDRHVADSDAWIATSLARSFALATPEQQAKMKQHIETSLKSVVGTMIPLRRQRHHFLQWLPDAASHTLSLAAELQGGDEQTTAEQLLQPLLYGTDEKIAATAQQLLTIPAQADLRKLNPNGRDYLTADMQKLPIMLNELLTTGSMEDNNLLPTIDWNHGQVENRATKKYTLYQLGRRLSLKGERYGRPELMVALSDSMLTVLNANGESAGTLTFAAATSDLANNLFNRVTIRGGLLILETASEVVAFDIYRGLRLDRDALLWRHSLVGASPESTFTSANVNIPNAALGIKFLRRTTPAEIPIVVGPLTPACLVIQTGTSILGLDLLSGKRIWNLEGYDNKDVRIAAKGLEIAIVNPAEGKVQVVDCRDGMTIREREYRGLWNHWFSHNDVMVEYRQEPDSSSVELRLWNALTDETILSKTVASYSRAAECEQRYIVIAQPEGKVLFVDLETLVTNEFECAVDRDLDSIAVERFQDRLVVISESIRSRNRQILRASVDVPMNGSIYAIDIASGKMLWDKPGKVYNMTFPVSQPRNSPFMVTHRFFEGNGPGLASLAIVDLRNGELVFVDSPMIVRALGFSMELQPSEQKLAIAIGDRNYELTFTDDEKAPQPVVAFGAEYRRSAIRRPNNIFPPE